MKTHNINVDGYNVVGYEYGAGDKALLLLHGGPGVPSDYLRESHKQYSDLGMRVITWDQLGCGESDKVHDTSLFTVDRFAHEVEAVRQYFNITELHLLGQSWGGVLALEFYLKYPSYVKSIIMANTAYYLDMMQEGFNKLKRLHGNNVSEIMLKHEIENTTDSEEYQTLLSELSYKHICNCKEWDSNLEYSMSNIADNVLEKIFGKYLFNVRRAWRRSKW